jgi:hypothetical protein
MDEPPALGRLQLRPRAVVERLPSGLDRAVDVLLVALGDVGEHLAGGRVVGLERLPRCGGHPLASNEQRVVLRGELPHSRV